MTCRANSHDSLTHLSPAHDDLDDFSGTVPWHHISGQRSSSTGLPTTAYGLPPCRSAERQSPVPPRRCTTHRPHRPPRGASRSSSRGKHNISNRPSLYANCWKFTTGSITSNHDEHAHTKNFYQRLVPLFFPLYFVLVFSPRCYNLAQPVVHINMQNQPPNTMPKPTRTCSWTLKAYTDTAKQHQITWTPNLVHVLD